MYRFPPLFLFVICLFCWVSDIQAQTDTLPHFEEGTIRVSRPHTAPYFSVSYAFTVVNSPIPDPSRIRAWFVPKAKDTLDRHRLLQVFPERTDLSLDLSKRVHVIQSRMDTPFLDSVRLLFHLNKVGKLTAYSLEETNPFTDSVKKVSWKPHSAFAEMVQESYALFGAYFLDQPITPSSPETAVRLNGKWKPGGYIKRKKRKKRRHREEEEETEIPVASIFKQEYNGMVTIYYSSFPQTTEQLENGIRFVTNDLKRELLLRVLKTK